MTQFQTLGSLLKNQVENFPKEHAIGWIKNNRVYNYTFQEYYGVIEEVAAGLISLGVEPQDCIAILSQTRKEWHLADISSMAARAVVVPIYPTYTSNDILYLLQHSESKVCFVEDEDQFNKILKIQDELNHLTHIVSFNTIEQTQSSQLKDSIRHISFLDLSTQGLEKLASDSELISNIINAQKPDDIASIIYTSGTTGEPKGTVITHEAVTAMLANLKQELSGALTHKDKNLTFLPLSHVLGRCDSLLCICFGLQNIYAESIETVGENIALAKPTIVIGVPRVFEKIYAKIMATFEKKPYPIRKLFKWATKVTERYYDRIDQDQSPSAKEVFDKKLAYKLVFSKIYGKLGGKIRFLITGGAPLSTTIIKFLRNANFTVLEGYGLTETIAPCTLNPVHKQVPGAVGIPLGDVQVKFAEDEEILLKSKALFREYYKNPEATERAFEDGWFKTGDIGRLTPEGYLVITDRKKDIIITSGGKNVAPQKIEGMMTKQKYIGDCLIVGDQRKYLTAIIGLNIDDFGASEFKEHNIGELAQHPKVKALIQEQVEQINDKLASYETIKKFFISPEPFTVENGSLTPSMKLKKKVIIQRYAEHIDAMYPEQ